MCGKNSNSPANVDLFFVDLYQGKLSSIPISFTFINQMYLLLSCFRLKRQRGGGDTSSSISTSVADTYGLLYS